MSELRLTFEWVADAVSGRLSGDTHGDALGAVVIDSRTSKAGDLFVALRGARFDGHAFVGDAVENGATGAIVEDGFAARVTTGRAADRTGPASALIEVVDTTRALQDLAHAVRVASGTRVVAVTGSAGKTTTKDTIAALLGARFRVAKNKGNLNNHIGLPLSLMQLRERPDVAVMELGMNHPGEISTLVAIAEPEVRVWTNVGDAHIGALATPDAIADAKAEILEGAASDDVLVCNADDRLVMARASAFAGRTVTFGTSAGASVRAVDVEDLGVEGMRARLMTPAGTASIDTPLLGRGNLSNVLAATTVALEFGIPLDAIVERVASLSASDRRGVVHRLKGGVTLIDDSYNSSPAALARALDVVAKETRAARKIAVLGEMLELGAHATALHEASGHAAAAAGLRLLVSVGGQPARVLAASAVAAGMAASSVTYFENSEQAAAAVLTNLRAGDLVLVKGSRGIRTDLIADRIIAEFA